MLLLIIPVFFLFNAIAAVQSGIHYEPDFKEAIKKAKEENKLVFIVFNEKDSN